MRGIPLQHKNIRGVRDGCCWFVGCVDGGVGWLAVAGGEPYWPGYGLVALMRLVQASLAAVGAFWSELIPAPSPTPSLWDYEGAALADREAEIDSWEPDGLLGREPSHADFDDEPTASFDNGPKYGMTCRACDGDISTCGCFDEDDERPGRGNGNDAGDGAELSSGAPVASKGAGVWNLPRDPAPSVAVTVPAVAAVPAGVCTDPPVLVPPAGLPFTFNADELVTTATRLISQHYRHNGGRTARASEAAELVVSQLVADLTAAYTAAEPQLIPPTVTRVVLVHGSYPEQTVTERWAKEWDIHVQDDGRTLKLFSWNSTGPRYEHTPGFFEQK
jgi:hypothetical protein